MGQIVGGSFMETIIIPPSEFSSVLLKVAGLAECVVVSLQPYRAPRSDTNMERGGINVQ